MDVNRFINPYTFAPFPESVRRKQPEGHEMLSPSNFSGRITIEWQMLTPIMLPQDWNPGMQIMPGSSIKGAVRSLHETLTGSCLRVFDSDFVPVYRQTMDEGLKASDGWKLAEVEIDNNDQPHFYPAEDTVWVEASQILEANPGHRPKTGARYSITNYDTVDNAYSSRSHLKPTSTVNPADEGDWYILVSDANARKRTKPPLLHYYYAMGKSGGEEVELDQGVRADFLNKLQGVDDDRPGSKDKRRRNKGNKDEGATNESEQWQSVSFRGRYMNKVDFIPVGQRQIAGPKMRPKVVWVHVETKNDQSVITDISLAVIWRHKGEHSAGARLPDQTLLACTNPRELCPSCRVFGMADASGGSESAEQNSYAAHVRFTGASTNAKTTTRQQLIRGLMSPRPGFGPFYLQITNTAKASGDKDDPPEKKRPTGRWGSIHDDPPRRLRGRKNYWHANPEPEPPKTNDTALDSTSELHRWYSRHDAADRKSRAAGRVGQVNDKTRWLLYGDFAGNPRSEWDLRSTVVFDNLSLEDLGGLIAALDPRRLFAHLSDDLTTSGREFATHLGGGKPLGLGSVTPKISEMKTWGGERYASTAPPDGQLEQSEFETQAEAAVKAFIKAHTDDEGGHDLDEQWKALAHILDIHKVDPNLVWYPPGAHRSYICHPTGDKEFDETFQFFTLTDGNARGRLLHPLPDPTSDDPSLPIVTKKPPEPKEPRQAEDKRAGANQGGSRRSSANQGGSRQRGRRRR